MKHEERKKIEILNNRIRLLEIQNDQLNGEKERLTACIHQMESTNQEQQRILQEQQKEYDRLLSECRQIKEEAGKAAEQMYKLMSEYKRDVGEIRRGHRIGRQKA